MLPPTATSTTDWPSGNHGSHRNWRGPPCPNPSKITGPAATGAKSLARSGDVLESLRVPPQTTSIRSILSPSYRQRLDQFFFQKAASLLTERHLPPGTQ